MSSITEDTEKFWGAAFFYRRAPDRDQTYAIRVLCDISIHSTGTVKSRALAMMRTIHDDAKRTRENERSEAAGTSRPSGADDA